jgi:hypothetical protein
MHAKPQSPVQTLNGKHDNFELIKCINKIGSEVLVRRDAHEHSASRRRMYVEEAGFLVVDEHDTPEKKKQLEREIAARKAANAETQARMHLASPAGRAAVERQAAIERAARAQVEAAAGAKG